MIGNVSTPCAVDLWHGQCQWEILGQNTQEQRTRVLDMSSHQDSKGMGGEVYFIAVMSRTYARWL